MPRWRMWNHTWMDNVYEESLMLPSTASFHSVNSQTNYYENSQENSHGSPETVLVRKSGKKVKG